LQKQLPSPASRKGCLARESTEQERALALLRRKQHEREHAERATATPSTVNSGDGRLGYADVFSRREAEDAYHERDRSWRHRRWEDNGRDSQRRRHYKVRLAKKPAKNLEAEAQNSAGTQPAIAQVMTHA